MKSKTTRGQRKKPVEWQEIHHRLDDLRIAVERGWSPQPEEKKRILEARTRTLAQQPPEPEDAEQRIEVIEFCLAYENYGVESSFVREVFPLTDLTRLPCTPPFVLGVVNVRGEIVSVINLKKFFDLPEKGLTDLNKVVILQSDSMMFGILADLVVGVRTMPTSELQPSLPTLSGIREQYLKGVTKDRTVILDAEKLLSDRKIVVHEEVTT
ncbi:MAG TPA: chemotaxis protein CheW [Acidiferrobacterales bacterium]|nr:chemotaxis protein CheW [Acidiferrobacterales bacterium]